MKSFKIELNFDENTGKTSLNNLVSLLFCYTVMISVIHNPHITNCVSKFR